MVEYTDRYAFLNDIKERYCLPFEEEENMDNTVTRIERRSDGSYIVTVNGKNFECENAQAMLSFLEEVGDGRI